MKIDQISQIWKRFHKLNIFKCYYLFFISTLLGKSTLWIVAMQTENIWPKTKIEIGWWMKVWEVMHFVRYAVTKHRANITEYPVAMDAEAFSSARFAGTPGKLPILHRSISQNDTKDYILYARYHNMYNIVYNTWFEAHRSIIHRNLDYVCKEKGQCIVDVSRRNQCQACRFTKCLQVNMKRDGKLLIFFF